MQQFTELLDEKTVSLDEILAFIDSSDFDLPIADPREDPVDFSASCMDVEDSLVSPQDHRVKDDKPSVTQEIQIETTHDQDANKSGRSSPSKKPFQERGRVRDRVIRFRGMVKRLEQQLDDLNKSKLRTQEQDNQSHESQIILAASAGIEDRDAVTWQEIAMHQFAARREAEKENLSLRETLEEQLRVAKRLEHLLRSHQVPYEA